MKRTAYTPLLVLALLAACPSAATAGDIVFPPGANVINVVRDRGIDNTGKTDVQPALQKLFDTYEEFGKTTIIYFPKGTYLLGGMLHLRIERERGPRKEGNHGPFVIGESREETIFRLKDGTWTTFDRKLPPPENVAAADIKIYRLLDSQVVFHTGDSTNTTFNKLIRNFTVNTGRNNPAAIGVMYCTSNSGCMSDITIISEDGMAMCGLAMTGAESGPGQVRNVDIKGFDVGIYCTTAYSFAVSNVTMTDIGRVAIHNRGRIGCENLKIAVRKTDSPAVTNLGLLTIVGLQLDGQCGKVAIENVQGKGVMYLRDVKTRGFASAVEAGKNDVAELATGAPVTGLFNDAKTSLKLPIKQAPDVPYEKDFSKWATPQDYGAKGDDTTDDTDAVQKALNDPAKTHIYIPNGKWAGTKKANRFVITKTITVGPSIERIVGGSGNFRTTNDARLKIADGPKPLVIEMVSGLPALDYDGGRTLILDSVGFARRDDSSKFSLELHGTGDVFINNMPQPMLVDNPAQHVWLRHYNNESGPPKSRDIPDTNQWQRVTAAKAYELHVKAGAVWVMGWKSENLRQRAIVEDGGRLEVLCFDNYSQTAAGTKRDGDWPMFRVLGGDFALCGLVQHGNENNFNLVWETRNGVTKKLTKQSNGSGNLALYTGYVK